MMTASEHSVNEELSRDLSTYHLVMMGMGMMIGAGVFLGLGNAIRVAGPGGAVLTFGINGLLALLTAMSYAELSSAMPKAGGTYNFARLAFGRGTSFISGWLQWFASSVAGSMYALTFAIYTVRFLDQLGCLGWLGPHLHLLEKGVAVAIALAFVYVNYQGASETGKIGAFFTLGQTAILLVIGAAGIVVCFRDPERLSNFSPFLPNGWSSLLATLGFTYVAFEGFEVIAQAGDEAINPRESLPKAMLWSVVSVTVTYVLVSLATIVAVKPGAQGVTDPAWQWIGQFSERGFGEAVSRLMPFGNLLLTLAVIFASTSALNATLYSATRSAYALGRDRLLPPALGSISRKHNTPSVALLATAVIVIVTAVCLPTLDVAASASIMFIFLFLLTNACAIRMRRHMQGELTYGFLTPFFPILPVIAILCQIVLALWLVNVSWIAWTVAPLWLAAGLGIYFGYSKRRADYVDGEIVALTEAGEAPKTGYRVLLPVANPDNALSMVGAAYRICRSRNASVELLHMVPVPDQVPLADASRYMRPGEEGLGEAMLYLETHFPVRRTIRYCRNPARGIISTIRERKADLVIMGWNNRSGYFYRSGPGRLVAPIVRLAACDVVVMKDCRNCSFKHILVPIAGGHSAALAFEIAARLVDEDGHITVFTVITGRHPFSAEQFVAQHLDRIPLPPDRITVKAVPGGDVATAIMAEARGYDLTVMGFTEDRFLRRALHESIPESVAERLPKPIVLVRSAKGVRGLANRWM